MAFTEAQRVKLRSFLGWPDVHQQYNPYLEGTFTTIGARPDTQARVESVITAIEAVETKLKAVAISFAGLKRAEDIEWYPSGQAGGQIDVLRSEGRRLVGQLSTIFGVEIKSDYFGAGGMNTTRSSSGYIKLG